MKLPAIQLYPGDWLRDAIAGCSLAAQGLWLRMMFLGHDSERYGYLCVNGAPIPPESIARRCGCTLEQYTTLIAELTAAGIPSCTPEGVIFSRRMVNDAKKRTGNATRQRRFRNGSSNANSNAPVTPLSEDEDEDEIRKRGEGEKPDAAIPTQAEVLAVCQLEAVPEPLGRRFYQHYEGNSLWTNQHGRLINWRVKLRQWRENERQHSPNGAPTNGKPPVTVFHLKTVMEAKEKQASALKGKYSAEVASGVEWSDPEKRKEYAKLRGEIKELNNQLANMA